MSGAKFNHDAILETMRVGLREGMNLSLVRASRLMRGQLSHPGRGTLYRVAKGKAKGRNLRARGFHRASFPGQSPAALTGSLRASWSVETVGNRPDGFANIFEDGRDVILRHFLLRRRCLHSAQLRRNRRPSYSAKDVRQSARVPQDSRHP